jgi:hypothetical protein
MVSANLGVVLVAILCQAPPPATTVRLCADFALFPNNTRMPASFTLGGFSFRQVGGGTLVVKQSPSGKGLQFPRSGLRATLPAPASTVDIRVGTFATAVKVVAYNAANRVVRTQMVPRANRYVAVTITAPARERIAYVVLSEGDNEGRLGEVCVKLALAAP